MNDFLEETIEISKNEHTILVEKYRPATLDGYIGDKAFKEALASYIEKKDIPHLLFYNSSPGTGKCLDGDEYIDIQMDVTDDEYEILKKYELFE